MSQSGGSGPDFHLPDEILEVIPTNPYDQLDLARKITSMAIASRVSKLELEVGSLKQQMSEKDHQILELEDKASHLEQAYHEADLRLKIARDDNMKLSKERDSLALTARKLGRDLAKLEAFKRQLMQSLNDDNLSQAETVDIVTYDQSVPKSYPVTDEDTNGHSAHRSFSSTESGYLTEDALKQAGQRFSRTPYITPRLTPTGTPKIVSTTGSPIRYSAAVSPQETSRATSPTKTQYEGRSALSSWYPSSQQSSAANSPPRGHPVPARTLRIDGKEFFRQARSRLSYEQFSAFLSNIKELNAQKQSREEALRKAEEIFGLDNRDLFLSFQGLLNRNIH
ncbi:Angiomotin, C-terminal protein [Actinidia chinensis var. chinensis]|uniref:Angiomotin, C-terminal protein n=1 Tax=Actinidia chinensis var. chinensis TaxID=1590841 RepID=A0A2R6QTE6_ACTCC|nr:Angiomotin, C-terminal protein [Actinidia chinensis var. chinensis]